MSPKPPTKSQIDYAKHLLKQVGADEPDWDKLDGVEVSTLIDALKKKRGKPVWYGNGQFSHWEKAGTKVILATGQMTWEHARMMLRVAARYRLTMTQGQVTFMSCSALYPIARKKPVQETVVQRTTI